MQGSEIKVVRRADGQHELYPLHAERLGIGHLVISEDAFTALETTLQKLRSEVAVLEQRNSQSDRFSRDIAITPDGKRAVTASYSGKLRVWDLEQTRELASFTAENPLQACAITRDGATVVAGEHLSGRVHLLRLEGA